MGGRLCVTMDCLSFYILIIQNKNLPIYKQNIYWIVCTTFSKLLCHFGNVEAGQSFWLLVNI